MATKRDTDQDVMLTIRLPRSLRDELFELRAQDRERTLAAEIRVAIRAHLERERQAAAA